MSDRIGALVDGGDLDELLRAVDGLCETREWDLLAELKDRCRAAIERGRQLWPAAAHAEYRLALEAPGRWAAAVLVPGTGRFALGPLSEVAASTHPWADLAPHVTPGPVASLAAHERVVRGEDLTGDDRAGPPVLDLPLRLQPWEPAYPLAAYRAHTAEFPDPPTPPLSPVEGAVAGRRVEDPDGCRALLDLAAAWTDESDGRAEAVAVEGDALAAVAALGVVGARMRAAEVGPADALAVMAWAAASGGGHGRRRGAATGRFGAWWVVGALGGLLDEWPPPPDAVGEVAHGLRWLLWDAGEPGTGWALHLAAADPATGRAWAVAATDAV